MADTSQRRAVRNYRCRLVESGMARFEVLGRESDRDLIRLFARRLAEGGPAAERLRAAARRDVSGEPPRQGGILEALRRSPLVGAEVMPARAVEPGRKVDL